MNTVTETSDVMILDLLRKVGPLSVSQLATQMQVTATAVRQRLTRLSALGFIQRAAVNAGRGRPSHQYDLTEKGRRQTGANFADLAVALWEEIRSIQDPEVRRGLLTRISKRLVEQYAGQIGGRDLPERMKQLAAVFNERKIPFEVDQSGELPVLRAAACPYPDLAEKDRAICSVERMMFSDLLGQSVRLSNCRLDGGTCCTFEPSSADRNDANSTEAAG